MLRMMLPSPAIILPAEAPHFGAEGKIAFHVFRDLPAREGSLLPPISATQQGAGVSSAPRAAPPNAGDHR